MTPDAIFDWVAPLLSEGELGVLLSIVGRTCGFAKSREAISIEQLCHGLAREDGTRRDLGTGMSRSAVMRALRALRERHLIVAEQQKDTPYGQPPRSTPWTLLRHRHGYLATPCRTSCATLLCHCS
ncbi:MAG: hypothetical protein NVSMB65_19060 [Chloroflexota bacterium]